MSDYIERGALMDKIGERLAYLRDKNGDYDPYTDGYEECYCEVEEAPAADVAPVRHGQWESEGAKIRCSACAHRVYLGSADENVHDEEKKAFGYCPHCGAKMDGGDDDATNHV